MICYQYVIMSLHFQYLPNYHSLKRKQAAARKSNCLAASFWPPLAPSLLAYFTLNEVRRSLSGQ